MRTTKKQQKMLHVTPTLTLKLENTVPRNPPYFQETSFLLHQPTSITTLCTRDEPIRILQLLPRSKWTR